MEEIRPLSDLERKLVELLIREGLPTAGELREQLNYATALGSCPMVEFQVDPAAPRSKIISKGIVEGRNRHSEMIDWSHILLWIDEGRISALELAWVSVSDEEPREFPSPRDVIVEHESSPDPQQAAKAAQHRWLISWPLIAGTVGGLIGFATGLPTHCELGRCQSIVFDSIPFLTDITMPESWTTGRRNPGTLFAILGMCLGAWASTRVVHVFRRRKLGRSV